MKAHRQPSGKYRVWVKVAGQTRTVTADTAAAAMREANQIAIAMGDVTAARNGSKTTVLELLTHHLALKGADLSPSTLAEYSRVVERLSHDTLADRPINRLRAPDLTAYYQTCLRNGWSVGSVRRLHELMHAAWKQTAIYRGWAVINPAASARPPKRAPYQISPPDKATLRLLFDAADDQFRLYLRLSANTGARRGELVALRWSDIDLRTGELGIFRSVVYTPDSGVVERPTKTGKRGQRRITVASSILPLLQAHHDWQLSRLKGREPVYIFSDSAGLEHWFPDTPTLLFGRLRRRAGVTGVRLHDLRHFAATFLIASGLTPVQVAARLGHADPRTTLSTYSHWIPATDRQAADDLDAGL